MRAIQRNRVLDFLRAVRAATHPIAALGIAAFVAILVVWATTCYRPLRIDFHSGRMEWRLTVERGRVRVGNDPTRARELAALQSDDAAINNAAAIVEQDLANIRTAPVGPPGDHRLDFDRYADDVSVLTQMKRTRRNVTVDAESSHSLSIAWIAALVVIAPLHVTLRLAISARRARYSLCVNCGYDLRASGTICPECGASVRMNRSDADLFMGGSGNSHTGPRARSTLPCTPSKSTQH